MKKIIRLTESDLTRIVKRVINEESYTVKSGDNLFAISKKFGVDINTIAKTNNIKDVNKIRIGQTIQIPKKNTTQVTKSDSAYQDKYNKYYDKYNSAATRDTTAPYDDAEKQKKAIEIIKKMTNDQGIISKIPLHIRGFYQYLLGRTRVWDEKNLTPQEIEALKGFLLKFLKTKQKLLKYDFWFSAGASDTPTAMTSDRVKKDYERIGNVGIGKLLNPKMASVFKYFFGNAYVKYDKNTGAITITDNYDMNVTEYGKSAKEIYDGAVESIKLYNKGEGTEYGVIRNLASFRELTGYKGFPVNITIYNDVNKYPFKSDNKTVT